MDRAKMVNITASVMSSYNQTKFTYADAKSIDFIMAHASLVAMVGGLVTLFGVLLVLACTIFACCLDAGRSGTSSKGGSCCGGRKETYDHNVVVASKAGPSHVSDMHL